MKQLKILTYNVENLFLDTFPPKPVEKVEGLAKTIIEISPDVVCLQEVGGIKGLEIFAHTYLHNGWSFHLLEGNSNRGIEIAFLVKKEIPFEIVHKSNKNIALDYKSLPITSENDLIYYQKFARDISELQLIRNGKIEYCFLGVHLKSKLQEVSTDPSGAYKRSLEIKALLKLGSQRNKKNPNIKTILLGDFNSQIDTNQGSDEAELLAFQSNWSDILTVTDIPTQEKATYIQFDENETPHLMQLDYIFLPNSLLNQIDKEHSGIYRYKNSEGIPFALPQRTSEKFLLPSDHYPLVATIKV